MIWLIGNKGMLGHEVELLLTSKGLLYITTDIDCDITDTKALNDLGVGYYINIAALFLYIV